MLGTVKNATRMVDTQKVIFTFFETEAIQEKLKKIGIYSVIIVKNKISATVCDFIPPKFIQHAISSPLYGLLRVHQPAYRDISLSV